MRHRANGGPPPGDGRECISPVSWTGRCLDHAAPMCRVLYVTYLPGLYPRLRPLTPARRSPHPPAGTPTPSPPSPGCYRPWWRPRGGGPTQWSWRRLMALRSPPHPGSRATSTGARPSTEPPRDCRSPRGSSKTIGACTESGRSAECCRLLRRTTTAGRRLGRLPPDAPYGAASGSTRVGSPGAGGSPPDRSRSACAAASVS